MKNLGDSGALKNKNIVDTIPNERKVISTLIIALSMK